MFKFTVTTYETGKSEPAAKQEFESDMLFYGFGLVKTLINLPTCLMPGSRQNPVYYIDFAESVKGSKGNKWFYSLGIEKKDGSHFSSSDIMMVKTYVAEVRFNWKCDQKAA